MKNLPMPTIIKENDHPPYKYRLQVVGDLYVRIDNILGKECRAVRLANLHLWADGGTRLQMPVSRYRIYRLGRDEFRYRGLVCG